MIFTDLILICHRPYRHVNTHAYTHIAILSSSRSLLKFDIVIMGQLFQALFYPLNAFVSERRERQTQMQQEYNLLLSQTITKRIHTKPTTPTKPNGSEIEEDASLKIGEKK